MTDGASKETNVSHRNKAKRKKENNVTKNFDGVHSKCTLHCSEYSELNINSSTFYFILECFTSPQSHLFLSVLTLPILLDSYFSFGKARRQCFEIDIVLIVIPLIKVNVSVSCTLTDTHLQGLDPRQRDIPYKSQNKQTQ